MKQLGLILLGVIINFIAVAQNISNEDKLILDKIKQGNEKYSTIVSRFNQTRYVKLIDETINSSGDFKYSKPNQLLMDYSNPLGDVMIINGDNCLMNIGGKRNEVSAKANSKVRGLRNILATCLLGDLSQMEAVTITCETNSKHYVVTAEINKKTNKSNIAKVVLSYDKNDFSICILQTIEADGSYTSYELIDKKFNQNIDNNIFFTKNK